MHFARQSCMEIVSHFRLEIARVTSSILNE